MGLKVSTQPGTTAHLGNFYFQDFLHDKGNTAKHAKLVSGRAKKIITGCKFTLYSDISTSRVQRFLAQLRDNGNGISAQTFNFYLQAIKHFCRWMVQDRRTSDNPVQYLTGLNVHTDRRHDRRALTVEEARRLLSITEKSCISYGMTGNERTMLYRFAIETGLRSSELRSLKVSSF